MKKFIIALTACLLIGTSAFALGDESFSVGYTHLINIATSKDSNIKTVTTGPGLYVDGFEAILPFFGLAGHLDLCFPKTTKVDGKKVDTSYSSFTSVGARIMPTFILPLGEYVELRAGAGLGLIIMVTKYNSTLLGDVSASSIYFTFPIGASAQFKFNSFCGMKVGCDMQFKLKGWYKTNLSDKFLDIDTTNNTINPYIAITFFK